ncbi:amino acid synthesis family protein [Acuticoccus sediminis]|nr:amino acid synthesis family protein [Acuticoccus sediminis]
MDLVVRRDIIQRDDLHVIAGRAGDPPLTRISVVSVVENPFAGQQVDDLSPLVDGSVGLAHHMVEIATGLCRGLDIQSYGKAGLVGLAGEQEHANALLTTAFANPLRDMIGDPVAWISSVTKVAPAGTLIDVPVNNIHDIYVRSHYDAVSLCFPGTPMPDEIAVIFCMLTRGRIGARVGGLTHEEARSRRKAASA